MKVAFASISGEYLDCHFGKCTTFSIYDFAESGYQWLESRTIPEVSSKASEQNGTQERLEAIHDCKLLFVHHIGLEAAKKLLNERLLVLKSEVGAVVTDQLDRLQQLLKDRPPVWLTSAMQSEESEFSREE